MMRYGIVWMLACVAVGLSAQESSEPTKIWSAPISSVRDGEAVPGLALDVKRETIVGEPAVTLSGARDQLLANTGYLGLGHFGEFELRGKFLLKDATSSFCVVFTAPPKKEGEKPVRYSFGVTRIKTVTAIPGKPPAEKPFKEHLGVNQWIPFSVRFSDTGAKLSIADSETGRIPLENYITTFQLGNLANTTAWTALELYEISPRPDTLARDNAIGNVTKEASK